MDVGCLDESVSIDAADARGSKTGMGVCVSLHALEESLKGNESYQFLAVVQ